MKRIEILGTGCAKCNRLERNVRKAVEKAGIKAKILKISKIEDIMERGVMITPGLVVDGVVVASGSVPAVDDIVDILK
ncbi:MAG: thioredoxin family protein [Thermoplasmatota archaeon]